MGRLLPVPLLDLAARSAAAATTPSLPGCRLGIDENMADAAAPLSGDCCPWSLFELPLDFGGLQLLLLLLSAVVAILLLSVLGGVCTKLPFHRAPRCGLRFGCWANLSLCLSWAGRLQSISICLLMYIKVVYCIGRDRSICKLNQQQQHTTTATNTKQLQSVFSLLTTVSSMLLCWGAGWALAGRWLGAVRWWMAASILLALL